MTEVLLFSYGTLQDPQVQGANFGRRLDGSADALPGCDQTLVEITDPEVIVESGLTTTRSSARPPTARVGSMARSSASLKPSFAPPTTTRSTTTTASA